MTNVLIQIVFHVIMKIIININDIKQNLVKYELVLSHSKCIH